MSITIIVPVKNEEKNIRDCLNSVTWADQVFVVDSNSQDDTRAIAESMGAEVVQFAYDGGWPKKKNWAIRNLPIRNELPFFDVLRVSQRCEYRARILEGRKLALVPHRGSHVSECRHKESG